MLIGARPARANTAKGVSASHAGLLTDSGTQISNTQIICENNLASAISYASSTVAEKLPCMLQSNNHFSRTCNSFYFFIRQPCGVVQLVHAAHLYSLQPMRALEVTF